MRNQENEIDGTTLVATEQATKGYALGHGEREL
jgi:hypothetical protein